MNNLALFTFIAVGSASQATGCVISTGSAHDGGSLDVSWSLIGECPPGATIEVISQQTSSGVRFSDLYDCATTGRVLTAELPFGDYDVWLEIVDATGTTLFAQSNSFPASLRFNGQIAAVSVAPFPVAEGFFGLTWTLIDPNENPLTCAEVGGAGVDIVATHASTSTATTDIFDCEAGGGISREVLLGTHTLVVDVLDANDDALGTSAAREETISFGNELVDLGNFDFVFE